MDDTPDKPFAGLTPRSADRPGPGLHVVATPIGNRGDITARALAVLAGADTVLCEDTRTTGRLFSYYGLHARFQPYHEHNATQVRPGLLQRLADGATLALVCDAGTPLISDPGYRLVAESHDQGIAVHAVPGPAALTAALSVAGLPTDQVHFAGFPPAKAKARRDFYAALAGLAATLAFYEAPHRLAASLADMATTLGTERHAVVLRELTKRHESRTAGPLGTLAERYARGDGATRGECVVLIAPPEAAAAAPDPAGDADLLALLDAALAHMPTRAAADRLARLTGYRRKALYDLALTRRGTDDAHDG